MNVEYREISLDKIEVPYDNMRIDMDVDDLEASYEASGQFYLPILVEQEEDYYNLLEGRRRLEVLRRRGVKNQSVLVIKDATFEEIDRIRVLTNVIRKDLNDYELGREFQSKATEYGFSDRKLAALYGVKEDFVYLRKALLRWGIEIQLAVKEGKISLSHAKHISRVPEEYHLKFIKEAEKVSSDELRKRIVSFLAKLEKENQEQENKESENQETKEYIPEVEVNEIVDNAETEVLDNLIEQMRIVSKKYASNVSNLVDEIDWRYLDNRTIEFLSKVFKNIPVEENDGES